MAAVGDRSKSVGRLNIVGRALDFVSDTKHGIYFMAMFFFFEIFVNVFVINNIKYTEIDWVAYMQEVEGFVNGTYDYAQLKGDTGPLVYPAGFVYIFTALYHLTSSGKDVRLAQYVFAFIYQITLLFVFFIYHKTKKVPPYAFFFMCCASYRIHSVYVLRLFNDPVAMTIFYASACLMLIDRWTLACIVYSLAVSVKMNILLFAPGVFVLLLIRLGIFRTILNLALCALVQLALGAPFLLTHPVSYLHRSFEFGRQFLFQWTVNWRFLPEEVFQDRRFHVLLLVLHVSCILILATTLWTRKHGGLKAVLFNMKSSRKLEGTDIILTLFTCNFVGMCFSRSLHYQFYVWYFHTLHFLLWCTRLPSAIRLLILGVLELCWNRYPSTDESSLAMHLCHLVILVAIFLIDRGFGNKEDARKKSEKQNQGNGKRLLAKKIE